MRAARVHSARVELFDSLKKKMLTTVLSWFRRQPFGEKAQFTELVLVFLLCLSALLNGIELIKNGRVR